MRSLRKLSLGLFVSGFSVFVAGCGSAISAQESEVQTIVGRGGAFFDSRIQVINALSNPVDQTTCLYLSEFKKNQAPRFKNGESLTHEQKEFLETAELEAQSLNPLPVSIVELDKQLTEKEHLRRLRGALIIPFGVGASFMGFGIVAAAMAPLCPGCFWGGMTPGQVLTNPYALAFLGFGFSGVGLLTQAYRDLHSKNKAVRLEDAVLGGAEQTTSTHLGVTLAFIKTARSLPAASQNACPRNLTAKEIEPYFQTIAQQYQALSEVERKSKENDALSELKSSPGCYFSTEAGDEKLIYKAHPLDEQSKSLRMQMFSIRNNRSVQLIADEELKLQLSNDGGVGRKYVIDNEHGSMAIWIQPAGPAQVASGRLAHRLRSGAYAGNQDRLTGECHL